MDDMSIKALAPWFGGKRNMAPMIVQELGPHNSYWEPFCGSMAVLLAKPQATRSEACHMAMQKFDDAIKLHRNKSVIEFAKRMKG